MRETLRSLRVVTDLFKSAIKITREEIATRAGLNSAYFSQLLNSADKDLVKQPSAEVVRNIVRVLQLTFEDKRGVLPPQAIKEIDTELEKITSRYGIRTAHRSQPSGVIGAL